VDNRSAKFLGLREYARWREAKGLTGTTHRAVTKAIESGRLFKSIKNIGGKVRINPIIADQEWDVTTRPAPLKVTPERTENENPEKTVRDNPMANARLMDLAFSAKMSRLRFEEKSGKLVDIDKVRIEAFKVHRKIRDAINGLPDRLAPDLVMKNQHEISNIMREEITRVLKQLSKDIYANGNGN
jgi:hypothetical protein